MGCSDVVLVCTKCKRVIQQGHVLDHECRRCVFKYVPDVPREELLRK